MDGDAVPLRETTMRSLRKMVRRLGLLLGLSMVASVATWAADTGSAGAEGRGAGQELIAVAPPPFSEGIFPCSECHGPDDEVNAKPHPVDAHEEVVFEHDAENRWCLDCHDAKNRDKLHLADGRLIGFEESYRLCGQCHGPELRDWRAGDHGKRTGMWSGQKEYLLCAHCHNPHSPRIKPMKPMPPPIRQEKIR